MQHVAVRPAPAVSIDASEGAHVKVAVSEHAYALEGEHLFMFIFVVEVGRSK
jgi:hypothetical protein